MLPTTVEKIMEIVMGIRKGSLALPTSFAQWPLAHLVGSQNAP